MNDAPPPAPAPPHPPAFCDRCGAPWAPEWTACPHCRALQAQPPAAVPTFASSIGATLALYGVLLAGSLTLLLAEAGVRGELVLELVDAAIVLAWAGASFTAIRPALATRVATRWWALAVLGAGATVLLAWVVTTAAHRLLGFDLLETVVDFRTAGHGWPMLLLAICVQPAVIEELAFRGLLFASLGRILDGRETIVVTALMFAVLHLAVPSMPHLFVMGLVLGWLRLRSGSLLPCILLHFCHNAASLALEAAGV